MPAVYPSEIGEMLEAEPTPAPRYVCDCGQVYGALEGLEACAARRHDGSALQEAVDAMLAFPEPARDADWYRAWDELQALRGTR